MSYCALVGGHGLHRARVDDAKEEHGQVEGSQNVGHVLDALPVPTHKKPTPLSRSASPSKTLLMLLTGSTGALRTQTACINADAVKEGKSCMQQREGSKQVRNSRMQGQEVRRRALFVVDIEEDEAEENGQHCGKHKARAVVGHIPQVALPEPVSHSGRFSGP